MKPPRTLEYSEDLKTQVIRNAQSMVRGILHTELPCVACGATAREAAEHYLRTHQELLGLNELKSSSAFIFGLRTSPKLRTLNTGFSARRGSST